MSVLMLVTSIESDLLHFWFVRGLMVVVMVVCIIALRWLFLYWV